MTIVQFEKVLAPIEYKSRHDRVNLYLHWLLVRHYKIKTIGKYYKHHSQAVTDGENVSNKNFPVHTDSTVKTNKADIV